MTRLCLTFMLCVYAAGSMAQNPKAQAQLPTVVASKSFLGQTQSIPRTTLFTPQSSGVYRVTVYEETSSDVGGYLPEAFLSWTGGFTSYRAPVRTTSAHQNGTFEASGQLTINDTAGKPIQLIVTENPNEQGTYNLYVVVEKL